MNEESCLFFSLFWPLLNQASFLQVALSVVSIGSSLKSKLVGRGWFHQHVYTQLLHEKIPKVQKDSWVISVVLRFWDLWIYKQLIKHWWNWPPQPSKFKITFQWSKNDIAIIKLDRPVEWSDLVQPICLPDSGAENFAGKHGLLAGWGYEKDGEFSACKSLNAIIST